MTREEFIKVLDDKGYSYEIEGDKVVVTHRGNVHFHDLTSLPAGVVFRNGGHVFLESLTSLPPDAEFRNEGHVNLKSLTSIPPGVEFENWGSAGLESLMGGWFYQWYGNIEGIDNTILLNKMVKDGIFER
jgi:hypothetical protein